MWEYKVLQGTSDTGKLERELNTYAAARWEVVSMSQNGEWIIVILKRRKVVVGTGQQSS